MLDVELNLRKCLDKYLKNRSDAYKWLLDFNDLCHLLDDIIDIPERRQDNEFIGLVTNQYVEVLSADFYAQHRSKLYSVVKSAHHFYFTSVKWERSEVGWQIQYADVLRCCSNNAVVAVIEIVVMEETGSYKLAYEAGREVAFLTCEKSYHDHHNEKGEPI